MKKSCLLVIAFCLVQAKGIYAQQKAVNPEVQRIIALKKSGVFENNRLIKSATAVPAPARNVSPLSPAIATGCSCWMERDTAFHVVPFTGNNGCSGCPGAPPDYRNDDSFTDTTVILPFSFCFYGTNYNQVYINNNGNISLGTPYSTFTAESFPSTNFTMIAPFWSDVDSRDPASGLVYYKVTPTSLIVQWEQVGYFGSHADLLNTFQLIITDGLDTLIADSNNVSFCYRDMQWTTGDASAGVGGFGGSPATVGVNLGDGVEYVQLGLFDSPGTAFDGPYGNNDGVDVLDSQYFAFNVCGSTANIPPVLNIPPANCDTAIVNLDADYFLRVNYFAPEQNQTTTITYDAPAISGITVVSNTPGCKASLVLKIPGTGGTGLQNIQITATDDGLPAAASSHRFAIDFTGEMTGVHEATSAEGNLVLTHPSPTTFVAELRTVLNGKVFLYDVTGRLMQENAFNERAVLDAANLQSGIYFVEVRDASGKRTCGKLVKE